MEAWLQGPTGSGTAVPPFWGCMQVFWVHACTHSFSTSLLPTICVAALHLLSTHISLHVHWLLHQMGHCHPCHLRRLAGQEYWGGQAANTAAKNGRGEARGNQLRLWPLTHSLKCYVALSAAWSQLENQPWRNTTEKERWRRGE